MIIQCDNCKTRFKLNESAIKGTGVKVRCTKCESVFIVTRPDAEQAPLGTPEGAVPEAPPEVPEPPAPPSEESPQEEEKDWGLGLDDTEEAEAPKAPESEEEPVPEETVFDEPEEPSVDEAEEAEAPSISFDEPPEDETGEELEAPEEPVSEEISFDEPEEPSVDEAEEAEAPSISFDEPPVDEEEPSIDEEAGLGLEDEDEEPEDEEPEDEEPEDEEPSEDIDWSLGEDEEEGEGEGDFGDDVDWGLDEEESGSVEDYTSKLEKELSQDSGDGDLEETTSEAEQEAAPVEEAGVEEEPPQAEPSEEEPAAESAVEEEPAAESAVEEEPAAESAVEEEPEEEDQVEPSEEPVKKKRSKKFVVALLIILIGIGVVYFSGILESLLSPPKPAQITLVIKGLSGTFVQNEDLGKIYAVKGRIENISDEAQEVLGVKITIFDKAGGPLTSKTVSLARLVSNEELKTLSGEEIERHYKDLSKGSIPPHGTTPLMAIFSQLPKDMDELVVEVVR